MQPFDIASETQLLTNMLDHNPSLDSGLSFLKPIDFWDDSNRLVFQAINQMYSTKESINMVSVADKYKTLTNKTLPMVVFTNPIAPSTTKTLIEKLRNLSFTRAYRTAWLEINDYIENHNDVSDVNEWIEKRMLELLERNEDNPARLVGDICKDVNKNLDNLNEGKTGLKTGFQDLDNIIIGLKPGQLIVIAARPSMGKSQFAASILKNITDKYLQTAGFFSLEMTDVQMVSRYLADVANIDFQKFQNGKMNDQETESLIEAVEKLSQNKIYIDESLHIDVDELCKRIKIMKRKYNISVVVVDHLGLLSTGKMQNKNAEIEQITRKLKITAKNCEIPIILLSQLNRNVEREKDKIPHLSDLRDSGAIEQDADIVMMLYREEYYNPESTKKNIVEIFVRKNRDGMTGKVEMLFIRNKMRFQSLQSHSGGQF